MVAAAVKRCPNSDKGNRSAAAAMCYTCFNVFFSLLMMMRVIVLFLLINELYEHRQVNTTLAARAPILRDKWNIDISCEC